MKNWKSAKRELFCGTLSATVLPTARIYPGSKTLGQFKFDHSPNLWSRVLSAEAQPPYPKLFHGPFFTLSRFNALTHPTV